MGLFDYQSSTYLTENSWYMDFFIFLVVSVLEKVSEPVSEKIGTEKVSESVWETFGTGKDSELVSKIFGAEKMLVLVSEIFCPCLNNS